MTDCAAQAAGLEVVFVQRKPNDVQLSIERLFSDVRSCLDPGIAWEIHVSPYLSRGVLPRVRNLIAVRRAVRGRLAHVTGDVHYLGLALPRNGYVLTIHDCAVLHRLDGWRREVVRRLWFEWPARRAAVVTTISEATRRDLVRWLPRSLHGKLRLVPNCVGPEFVPMPRTFRVAAPVLLQVGTKHPKNFDRVVDAMRGTRCTLAVIGRLSEAQRAQLRAADLPFIEHGHLTDRDLVRAYRECDALIFVSLIEGFGLPIIEAQATGRPVITSNLSAMPETAGDGALLVDPEDVESIRAAVVRLVADEALRASLVARGYENVKRFAPGSIAAQYAAIYREVATATGSR